jgi:hypothetical protein
VIGASGVIASVGLMLLKTSMHGHYYPDYSFAMMASMATRLPAWTAAGVLIGFAVALLNYRLDGSDDPGGLS